MKNHYEKIGNIIMKTRWRTLTKKLNIPHQESKTIFTFMDSRYYHNWTHIFSSLTKYDNFVPNISSGANFELAIWFHDLIYNTNEKLSAEYAGRLLKNFLVETDIKEIQSLILSTIQIDYTKIIIQGNVDPCLYHFMHDIDFSGLGENWRNYHINSKNIRSEFYLLDNYDFYTARLKFLTSMSNIEIFATETFRDTYELKAHENILNEIKILETLREF